MNKHVFLMLGVSGLALVSAEAYAQCSQSRSVTCLDWQGNVVSDAFCNDSRVGARPAASQSCTGCGDGDGDKGGGGG